MTETSPESFDDDAPEPDAGRPPTQRQRARRRGRDEVVEISEEVTLPADGALLDVVELDDEDEDDEPEPSPYDRPGRWFVVHTYAGYENKVKQNLASRVRSMNVEERIFEVVIPMEDVIEFKNGRKVVVQKKVWPGYLLIRMGLDDESWYVVRNTPGSHRLRGQRRQAHPAVVQGGRGDPRRRRQGGGHAREEGPPRASSTRKASRSGWLPARSRTSTAPSVRSTWTAPSSRSS